MVPSDFVFLDALPYLASGKVDRKALSGHYKQLKRPPSAEDHAASPRVAEIAAIFGRVLRVDINASTQLPGAGLDSLSAIRIASQLHRSGFRQLDATAILEAQSVRDIDDMISQAEQSSEALHDSTRSEREIALLRDTARSFPLLASRQDEVEDVFAATPLQSAMLSENARDPQAYCNWITFDVVDIALTRIEAALRQLSASHEMLRSGFLAAQTPGSSHLVVVWKCLPASHITIVEKFDYEFSMQSDEEALHPCCFQLLESGGRAHILLKIHHASYDQWSIDVLKADLNGLLQNNATTLTTPFRNVSAFYASAQEKAQSDQALDFWQDHLRDFTATNVPDLNGRVVPRGLQRTSWHDMPIDIPGARDSAKDLGYSLPSVFQSAFAYLIAGYAGSQDVLFGAVFSGRHIAIPGIERTFGPCLATLPCRIDLSSVRSCLDLLRTTHDHNRTLQRHALTPLADIKKAGQCTPGSSLFDALFVWQETSMLSHEVGTLVTENDSADHHEFNLVLEFAPSGTGVALRATYQQSLLPAEHVTLMLRQVHCLAMHLIRSSDAPVESLASVYTEDLLSISNRQYSPCASTGNFVAAIESHADERPGSVALSFARDVSAESADVHYLSYAELNTRANALAYYLQSLGVEPNDMVCICMEKSFDLYVAILATVKSGAGYLPLVPETPPARLDLILRQANVHVCLCDTTSINMVKSVSAGIAVDTTELDLRPFSTQNPTVRASGSDIAYTVFTSGSTGEPKGVAVTRKNLADNLAALSELYHAAPGDCLLQACSQAFDVSVFEIFYGLTTGMCLCTATKEILFHDIERSIRVLGVSHLSLTPTVAALVDPRNVPNVCFLVTAGEAVTDFVHKRWAGNGLHQGYGPSETTNICTVNMNMAPADMLGNIGKPLRNTSAFVVSMVDDFVPLPLGAVGELAFGGEQVFRGYLGRDDLNATKLLDHPTWGRIYRSGDVGRMMSDGTLLITGRLDDQVKLRGNRIELGEVNAVMLQSPDVFDCTTVLVEDDVDQALACFWVSRASSATPAKQTGVRIEDKQATPRLFQHLDATLPSYMVPTSLIPITRMPMTAQGKLDRRLLRQLISGLDESSRAAVSRQVDEAEDNEWSTLEQELATALASTLRIPESKLHRTSSFFALGLNSLSAIAFAKAAEKNLHQRVSINTVLRNPSLARLSAALRRVDSPAPRARADETSVFPADFIARVEADRDASGPALESILPCTPLQEAMLSATASGGQSAYQNSTTYALTGDVEKLKWCWAELMARHAILRTKFVDTDLAEHPYAQVIVKQKALPWHVLDNHQNGDAFRDRQHMYEPFRIEISHAFPNVSMTVHMHHAIYDGTAMAILSREAEQLYHGSSSLAAPVSMGPFLAEILAQNGPEAVQFWSARIQGYQPKPIPRPSSTGISTQRTLTHTPTLDATQIEGMCKHHSVTPLSLFQTAWAKVLSVASQANDICFGSVVSGRSVAVAGAERLVAPCFNTLPIRVEMTKCKTNMQLAKRLHNQSIEAVDFQLTSLRRIQRMSRSPELHLFDSMMLLQPAQESLDPSIWELTNDEGTMDMPVVLEIVAGSSGFEVALHFLPSYIPESLAGHLLHAFTSAVASCLRYPSGDVGFLGEVDVHQITGKLRVEKAYEETRDRDRAPIDETSGLWTPEETHVRDVFASLSGVDPKHITRTTSMFRLGLDSLNAAQVAARLRKLGVRVDATDVVENLTASGICAAAAKHSPSVEARSAAVDLSAFEGRHRQAVTESISIDTEKLEAVRPCTAVQCGMIAQSLQSRGSLYVNHVTYEVPDGVTVSGVSEAWKAVQRKHQALRMGFCNIDDPLKPFAMLLWQAEGLTEPMIYRNSDQDAEAAETLAAGDIVDRLHVPAWRLSMLQTGKHMVISLHHALYDAESLQYLLSDFERAVSLQDDIGHSPTIDRTLMAALSAESDRSHEAAPFWQDTLSGAR